MAAVTSAIAAGVSLAGVGLNVAQLTKQQRAAKDAANAATSAANAIANIKEQNAFKSVQVPTLGYDLAQQGFDRAAQSALSASQGAGAEGVIGGVGQIMQAQSEQELNLAAQLDQSKYARDTAEATAQNAINQRAATRMEDLETMRLQGAQGAAAAAQTAKQKAIEGIFGSGISALKYADQAIGLYGNGKKDKTQ